MNQRTISFQTNDVVRLERQHTIRIYDAAQTSLEIFVIADGEVIQVIAADPSEKWFIDCPDEVEAK